MKRIVTILLLLILAFNWSGYQLLSGWMERNWDVSMEKKIDKADYDESTLVELRIPLNAPYITGTSDEFERYDGEAEINGVHYKYVKRKIVDGELVLMCLPDAAKMQFQNSRVDFIKLINDLQHPSQGKHHGSSGSYKDFVTEYRKESNCWSIAALMLQKQQYTNTHTCFNVRGYNSIPKQPPRA